MFSVKRGQFLSEKVSVFEEIGVFFRQKVSGKGVFFKMKNADTSYLKPMSEGAGL